MIGMHRSKWEFQLFRCQFTSWKKIRQITANKVDYLLSILIKEEYAAMDCWVPANAAYKYDSGKLLHYLESTLDDEISPWVRVYELEHIKKTTDETTDALMDCICQLAHHALIGDRSNVPVEIEAQHRLICAILDGDIELWKELLKVSCDKGISHLLEISCVLPCNCIEY